MRSIHHFLKKYGHAWLLLYMLLYFPWFHYLEKTVTTHYHVIHMDIDDLIPFNEYFIIPYFLWFAYVAVAVIYFLFCDKKDYYRLCGFLFTGMTIFLIISSLYPNGHHLRPVTFTHDDIFIKLVKTLYKTDTPTNIFPSIHVYNSLGVHIAISHNEKLRKNKWLQYGSFTLMVSIILSTLFLKQHSMFDVIGAFVLAALMHSVVYGKDYSSNQGHVFEKQFHDL